VDGSSIEVTPFPFLNEYKLFSLGFIDTTICLSKFTNGTSMPVKDVKMYRDVGRFPVISISTSDSLRIIYATICRSGLLNHTFTPLGEVEL
jgi:hypothetical protein